MLQPGKTFVTLWSLEMAVSSGSPLFLYQLLKFISTKPCEYVGLPMSYRPVVKDLEEAGFLSCHKMYPDMPDQDIWTVTKKAVKLIQEVEDASNRQREDGPSQAKS